MNTNNAQIDPSRPLSRSKRAIMWTITGAIPILAAILSVVGYYAYAKLTYEAYVCGSFGQIDSDIGWVLKPSAVSCLGGRSAFSSGPPWFESTVYTDKNGFRAARPGGDTAEQGIFITGDSFAFGYGVNFEDSFPGIIEKLTGVPVISAGSPAYSTPQGLLITERWHQRLRPRAIIHLERANWARAACSGQNRPTMILKPCYWQPPGQQVAELVLPPPGQVQRWARWSVLPGGMAGAGEMTWGYFVISRPVMQMLQAMVRLGMISGFGHDFAPIGVDPAAMRAATAQHIGRLAVAANVPVIVVDSDEFLPQQMLDELPPSQKKLIHRIGSEQWREAVTIPSESLPMNERQIPHDEHYAPGVNRLIAEMLTKELRRLKIVE